MTAEVRESQKRKTRNVGEPWELLQNDTPPLPLPLVMRIRGEVKSELVLVESECVQVTIIWFGLLTFSFDNICYTAIAHYTIAVHSYKLIFNKCCMQSYKASQLEIATGLHARSRRPLTRH